MVTAATYQKIHYFKSADRLKFLHELLLKTAEESGWKLHAWAVFPNHYHFIGRQEDGNSESLKAMIRKLHSLSAREMNRLDETQGRKIWHNYRDSHIQSEKSYLARLHYVHANAVHHGLVLKADQYPWCSARWFEQIENSARVNTIYSFPISKLIERDETL